MLPQMNIFLMLKNEGTQHTASAWIGETVFHSENEGEIHEEKNELLYFCYQFKRNRFLKNLS